MVWRRRHILALATRALGFFLIVWYPIKDVPGDRTSINKPGIYIICLKNQGEEDG